MKSRVKGGEFEKELCTWKPGYVWGGMSNENLFQSKQKSLKGSRCL